MNMGRLFWKFLLAFWLAQFFTATVVGLGIWLLHPDRPPPDGEWRGPPPAGERGFAAPPPRDRHPGPSGPQGSPLLRPPVTPILAGSVISLVFAALMAWYFSRPIRSLRSAFEAVAGGRLESRVGDAMGSRRDELADLGADFDRMADRLQALLDSQRRLLHDVSHELRSPLARLQAAADLMRQQPERAAEFVARIERDAGRMDRLVGELLTLARLDAGTTGGLDGEVELSEVIGDIVADARFEAAAKACTVAEDVPASLAVSGNPDLIYRAVENVVRNAVRHSPNGGRVEVSLRRDEPQRRVCIVVEDRGPGVPQEHLGAIFMPFFRSRCGDAFAGYGLGLAIARRVVEAHGGTVAAENRDGGGLRVTLALPARFAADA